MTQLFRSLFAVFATLAVAAAQTPAPSLTPAPEAAKKGPPPPAPLDPALPSLFVAGDSTAARGQGARQQGWGVPFADYFDTAKINIANRARGGRSSRTYIAEGSWERLLAELKADDIVLIQFGENDASPVAEDPSLPRERMRFRGTLPGVGDETREIDNLLTNQHEVVHTYGWYIRKMVADTKAKGASPIIVTVTVRNLWKDDKIERGNGSYPQWAAEVAKSTGVPYIDLTSHVANLFQEWGAEKTKAIYQQDFVHYNAEGADLHAKFVVAGLKGLKPSPLAKFLSAKGEAVEPVQNPVAAVSK